MLIDHAGMSWRARAYLSVAAVRHLLLGAAMTYQAEQFGSKAFLALFEIAPREFWAAALVIIGVHLSFSAIIGGEGAARAALVLSAALSFMWASAFGIVVLDGSASWLATLVFGALALKDLIVCAQPLRSPFEVLAPLYENSPPSTAPPLR